MERKHNIKFFVYIIESPSTKDFYDARSEGDLIEKAVSLNNIPSTLKVVVSKEMFKEALNTGIYEEMVKNVNLLPIIHLSAHGSSDGIQLTDGNTIQWYELREYFKPINKAFDGNLFLCMSSCQGYSACRMSMHESDTEYPFWGVAGNNTEPLWSETAVAYATLYHHLALGSSVPDAIEAMKVASGNKNFTFITASRAQKVYLEVIEENKTREIQTNLGENIEKENPGKTEEIKSKRNL